MIGHGLTHSPRDPPGFPPVLTQTQGISIQSLQTLQNTRTFWNTQNHENSHNTQNLRNPENIQNPENSQYLEDIQDSLDKTPKTRMAKLMAVHQPSYEG